MKPEEYETVESTMVNVATVIQVQCECGEAIFVSGKDAEATYAFWNRTHVCIYSGNPLVDAIVDKDTP